MENVWIVALLLGFLGHFILSMYVFDKLQKKGVFPVIYDIYTRKEKRTLQFEFARVTLFLTLSAVGFFLWGWKIAGLCLLLTYSQFVILKRKMYEGESDNLLFEFELEEQSANGEDKHSIHESSAPQEKIVVSREFIYLGKPDWLDFARIRTKRRISLYDKMYAYFILYSISREERVLEIRYGFLSIPLFKREFELSANQTAEADQLIEAVKKAREGRAKKNVSFDLEKRMFRKMFQEQVKKSKK